MKIDYNSLSTEELHSNIVSLSLILDLLSNGQFPGKACKNIETSIVWANSVRDSFIEEFVKRPDAREKYPESFQEENKSQPPQQPHQGAPGVQGV